MDIIQYFVNVLDFHRNMADALQEEGFTDFDEMIDLEDEEVIRMIKNVRKPGGGVNNRGHNVTGEQGLKIRRFAYYCFHFNRVNREMDPDDADELELKKYWELRKLEMK